MEPMTGNMYASLVESVSVCSRYCTIPWVVRASKISVANLHRGVSAHLFAVKSSVGANVNDEHRGEREVDVHWNEHKVCSDAHCSQQCIRQVQQQRHG